MIFEKEKYYKLIKDLEKRIDIYYAIVMIISILVGIASEFRYLTITIPIGLLVSYMITFGIRIRIQEMKWKFDMYELEIKKHSIHHNDKI